MKPLIMQAENTLKVQQKKTSGKPRAAKPKKAKVPQMARPLTKAQLDAVIYAVEALTAFAVCDTAGAIKKLCALDPRVRPAVKDNYGTMAFIFPQETRHDAREGTDAVGQ